MMFKDIYLSKDMDALQDIEANNDVSDMNEFYLELDFVEQYEDTDGILHIQTFFSHDDMKESDLCEVIAPNDDANPLELLLYDND